MDSWNKQEKLCLPSLQSIIRKGIENDSKV